jgi:hypothetical protein
MTIVRIDCHSVTPTQYTVQILLGRHPSTHPSRHPSTRYPSTTRTHHGYGQEWNGSHRVASHGIAVVDSLLCPFYIDFTSFTPFSLAIEVHAGVFSILCPSYGSRMFPHCARGCDRLVAATPATCSRHNTPSVHGHLCGYTGGHALPVSHFLNGR